MAAERRAAAAALLAVVLAGCSTGGGDTAESSGAATGSAPSRTPSPPTTGSSPSASVGTRTSAGASTTGASPGPGSSSPAAPAPVRGKPATITLSAIGDVLPHSVVNRDASTGSGYDYTRQLESIRPIVSGSTIGICQLETALSADNTRLTQKNTFNSPRELARDLRKIGFDGCSTANNHTWDAGARGLRETRKVLSDNGIAAAGPADSAAASGRPATYDAPIKVAQLSYSYSLMNSIEQDTTVTPSGFPWLRDNLYAAKGAAGIIADARRAKAAGAEVVLVSMHWGGQFQPTISADQKRLGDELLRSGAVDVILGAHPHLVQPCAKINGRYVLYSLGNLISTQGTAVGSPVGAQDGVVATVRLSRDAEGRISQSLTYQPTWVDRGDRHKVVLATPDRQPESYRRTVAAMSAGGCDAKPAQPTS